MNFVITVFVSFFLITSCCESVQKQQRVACDGFDTGWVHSAYIEDGSIVWANLKRGNKTVRKMLPGEQCVREFRTKPKKGDKNGNW